MQKWVKYVVFMYIIQHYKLSVSPLQFSTQHITFVKTEMIYKTLLKPTNNNIKYKPTGAVF